MAIVTAPDLDALEDLLAKARPHASGGIHFSVEGGSDFGLLVPGDPVARDALIAALPALLAYVRELEQERATAIGVGMTKSCLMANDVIVIAQREAALAMREKCAQACEKRQTGGVGDYAMLDAERRLCAAAVRALEP